VGIVNSAFGYGCFSFFVWIGFNIYLAQISSHLLGMTFNYFMLKTHVFPGKNPNIYRYIGAYAVNYALGLIFISLFHMVFSSPYLAGFLSLLTVSIINYFILKAFVFRAGSTGP
jgi:putative flippase GtrA